jgi:hypothetical protein
VSTPAYVVASPRPPACAGADEPEVPHRVPIEYPVKSPQSTCRVPPQSTREYPHVRWIFRPPARAGVDAAESAGDAAAEMRAARADGTGGYGLSGNAPKRERVQAGISLSGNQPKWESA